MNLEPVIIPAGVSQCVRSPLSLRGCVSAESGQLQTEDSSGRQSLHQRWNGILQQISMFITGHLLAPQSTDNVHYLKHNVFARK